MFKYARSHYCQNISFSSFNYVQVVMTVHVPIVVNSKLYMLQTNKLFCFLVHFLYYTIAACQIKNYNDFF